MMETASPRVGNEGSWIALQDSDGSGPETGVGGVVCCLAGGGDRQARARARAR